MVLQMIVPPLSQCVNLWHCMRLFSSFIYVYITPPPKLVSFAAIFRVSCNTPPKGTAAHIQTTFLSHCASNNQLNQWTVSDVNWSTSVSRYLNLRSLFIQDLWFAFTTWISKCKGKLCQCNHKTVTITGSTIKWLKIGCLLLIRTPQGPRPTSKKSPIFDCYPHSKISNVKDQTTSFLPLRFWLTTLMLWLLWRMFASFTSPISSLIRCLKSKKR